MAFDRIATFGFEAESQGAELQPVIKRLALTSRQSRLDRRTFGRALISSLTGATQIASTAQFLTRTAAARPTDQTAREQTTYAAMGASQPDGTDVTANLEAFQDGDYIMLRFGDDATDSDTVHARVERGSSIGGAPILYFYAAKATSQGQPWVYAPVEPDGETLGTLILWARTNAATYTLGLPWDTIFAGTPDMLPAWVEVGSNQALALVRVTTGEDFRQRSVTLRAQYDARLFNADFFDLDGDRYTIDSLSEEGNRRAIVFQGSGAEIE